MTKTEKIIAYYDNFLDYLKRDHEQENPRHAKIKQDLSKIIKKDMRVLDLGCGTGITTKYIAELGAKVVGIDISPKLIEFAKENSAHPNAHYFAEDITALPSRQAYCYDAICLIDIMEHIPRKRIPHLVETIKECSHKNTVIYLNIPDARFQKYMQKRHADRLQIVDEAYNMAEVINWFEMAGYEPISIEIYGLDLPVQYNSYVFVKEERIFDGYKKYLGGEASG